jgi:preprotein translocase subunit SecE
MAEEKKNQGAPAKAVTAVKKDETKLTVWQKIGKWFREMKSELKKVIWPSKEQLIKNSLISVGMIIISSIVIWGFDEIAQLLVRALLTLAG